MQLQRGQAPLTRLQPGGRAGSAPQQQGPAQPATGASRLPAAQQPQQAQQPAVSLPSRTQGSAARAADGGLRQAAPASASASAWARGQDDALRSNGVPPAGHPAGQPVRQAEQGPSESSGPPPQASQDEGLLSSSAPDSQRGSGDSRPAAAPSAALGSATGRPASAGLPSSGAPEASASGREHTAPDRQAADTALASRVPLRDLLQERNIVLRSYSAGQHNGLMCPVCQGGSTKEASFSINIEKDGTTAAYKCHRGTCNFEGGVSASTPASSSGRSRAGERPLPSQCAPLPMSSHSIWYRPAFPC